MSRDEAANDNLPAIAIAYQAEIERLCSELAIVEASRVQLVKLLSQLVSLFELHNGFMSPGELALLRHARLVLAEVLR